MRKHQPRPAEDRETQLRRTRAQVANHIIEAAEHDRRFLCDVVNAWIDTWTPTQILEEHIALGLDQE